MTAPRAIVEVAGVRFGGHGAGLLWNALHLLTRSFPRDSAIRRRPRRCPIGPRTAPPSESRAA